MTADRLTKNELTWLLAQEARSAAQKLRQGVAIYTTGGEPNVSAQPEDNQGNVENTLNRLDEAVSMLASLHGHSSGRGRRGKIDLAALLWEVAPEARVQIEMGEGTTVFGDESELRRMLHVLISLSGDPSSAQGTPGVIIRREGDEIRVGVNLGPDTSATLETERDWLSRMATRYGGRVELDGSMQTLVLPADIDMHRRELENLKKELAAAQAQGEAYARELAAMFNRELGYPTPQPPPVASGAGAAQGNDALFALVATVRALSTDLRGILSAIGRDITPLRDRNDEVGEIAASVGRHVTGASEIVTDLTRLSACPINEPLRSTDLVELLREALQSEQTRASRHEVKLALNAPESADEVLPAATLGTLLRLLIDHAIDASPPGSEVTISLVDEESGGITLTFDDASPSLAGGLPIRGFTREFEALVLGRPRALSLIAAATIAAHLKLPMEIGEGPHGGTRVRLSLSAETAA